MNLEQVSRLHILYTISLGTMLSGSPSWAIFFLFLDRMTRFLGRVGLFDRVIKWVFERTRRRGERIKRVEGIGLALFVGVPLPVTGAWTGSLVAFLFGIERKRAFLYITLGVFLAGAIVTVLCVTGNEAVLWLKGE